VTAINAGGGDWLDLPTAPVQHRGGPKHVGLPWQRITEEYVAAGGQVDAGVWHKGKVKIIEGGRRGIDRIHTYVEGGDYNESSAPRAARPKKTATASKPREYKVKPEDRPEIARRYQAGESISALARAFDAPDGSISFALRKMSVQTRSRAEAGQLRRERGKS
jgi:hypothetical protein